MKHLLILIILFLGVSVSMFSQETSPGGVKGAVLWINSINEGSQNCILKDKVSNSLLSKQGKYVKINDNNSFYIKGSNEIKSIPLKQSNKITLVGIFGQMDTSSEEVLLSLSINDSNKDVLTNNRLANLSDYRYLNFDKPNQNASIYTYVQNRNYDSLNTQNLLLQIAQKSGKQSIPAKSFKGSLPEMVLYDRVLSYSELCKVQSYFALKYGISLDQELMPLSYYNSKGKKVWDAEKNTQYKHNITGLGRDDLSGLNQITSTNVASINTPKIQLSKNNILENEQFIIWGDNNGRLKVSNEGGFKKVSDRKWLINHFGDYTDRSIDLEMDILYFEDNLNSNESYWLVVDKTGTGKFPIGETFYLKQNRREKNSIFFDNITFDNSFKPENVFTLIQAPDLFINKKIEEPYCFQDKNGSIKLEVIGGNIPYTLKLFKEKEEVFNNSFSSNKAEITNLEAGSYYLVLEDALNNKYEEKIYLSHKDMPAIALEDEYSLKRNQELKIDLSNTYSKTDYTFNWIYNGYSVSNNPTLYPKEEGVYKVEVCNNEGCRQFKEINIVNSNKSNFKNIQLYPNPSNDGFFNIRIHLYEPSDVEITISDMKGSVIKSTKTPNVSDFHVYQGYLNMKGIYVVTLQSKGSSESIKLIIP